MLSFWSTQALYGLSLTDDGVILAMSNRISEGQIPHFDFFTIRPAGSAYFHSLFINLDFGMLAFDRLIVVIELYFISYVTVRLLIRKSHESVVLSFLLTYIAFLVNINTWPIMAWHTIDGLFFLSIGLRLATVQCSQKFSQFMVNTFLWILVGCSMLTKQGFLLSLPIILFYLVAIHERKRIKYSVFTLIPICMYFLLSHNANPSAYMQISFGSSKGSDALLPLRVLITNFLEVSELFLLLITLTLTLKFSIEVKRKSTSLFSNRYLGAFGIYLIPIFMGIIQDFSMSGSWIYFVILNSSLNLTLLAQSRIQFSGLVVILLVAFVISLSRGVPTPSLLVGTFLVSGFFTHASFGLRILHDQHMRKQLMAATIFLVVLLTATSIARNNNIYQEGKRSEVGFEVNEPNLRYIKMSERTAKYITMVNNCVRKYPARHISILPDGAALYPILNLSNPFDIDWFYNMEIDPNFQGMGMSIHDSNMQSVVRMLNVNQGWLILFQSRKFTDYNVENVYRYETKFSYIEKDLGILDKLEGQSVKCGSLTGKYSP